MADSSVATVVGEPLLHLITTRQWRAALAAGRFAPAPGPFVHLSTPGQVPLPANRLFAGVRDLLLLALDRERLGAEVRWEPGVPDDPASMLFPHAYGAVPTSSVLAVLPYRPGPAGYAAPTLPQLDATARAALAESSVLRRTATREVPVTGGVAIRTDAVPRSQAHQSLLVDGPTTVEAVGREADAALGDLDHRRVVLVGAPQEGTIQALAVAGWQVQPLLDLAVAPGGPDDDQVDEVELDELRALWDAGWVAADPIMDAATRTQLADRYALEAEVVDLRYLAVRAQGQLVSAALLKIDGATAQLDAVETHLDHRGRGYGDALLRAARARAADAGCDLLVLSADADDWPARWYQRRGFTVVGRRWEATR